MKNTHLFFLALALGVAVAGLQAAGPPETRSTSSTTTTTTTTATEEVSDTQDVLYLGEGRPALIRLHLRVGGRSLFSAWDQYTEKLYKYLDRNQSGGLDRVEASRLPSAQQLQQLYMGQLSFYGRRVVAGTAPGGASGASVPFDTLDADRDGKVTLDEVRDYYKKNSAGPVQNQTVNAAMMGAFYSPYNPAATAAAQNDPLFDLIDADKDGRLSRAELLACEKILARYDDNDDELISQAELGIGAFNPYAGRTRVLPAQPRVMPAAPGAATNAVPPLLLIPREESRRGAARLDVARQILTGFDKDKDGKLDLTESRMSKEMFARIDRNRDDKLDAQELSRWLAGKPDGEFTVRLGGGGGAMMARTAVMAGPGAKRDDEMGLTLGNVRVNVVPQPAAQPYDIGQYITQLFKNVDERKQGFITRKQLDPQQHYYLNATFEMADANADGRLTEQELKEFVGVFKEAFGMQLSLNLAATGQGLFQTLDANGDGQLSLRERRNAWKRLSAFDADADGHVTKNEFPQQFRLSVSQSNTGYYVAAPAVVPGMAGVRGEVATRRGPVWFRKMDRNNDGDVSPTEWLGGKQEFDKIDADKDGLISVEEAESADAKMRK